MERSVLLILLLIGVGVSCQKDNLPIPPSANPACFESNPVTHQAKSLKGMVGYRQDVAMYTVNYHLPGTIDSQWTGLVCNLPSDYQVVGKQVQFSGEYRSTLGNIKPLFGGEEIYYLYLSSIN
ncbi:hypothetical protein EXU85_19245 [Spirosoma sp. KCTC 42546]|uniref:hypothetical protein n=1 Tax=Spirosoma sp. KCTC 42546 TaxID=2520506 RepID=UPI001157FF82|nr:hypothetical protein [Spirosoma sp. KCTC 42546]QDK80627.1 hypothetical protein EXU85_19245 [Spirosoma sp. KCTC 42546]